MTYRSLAICILAAGLVSACATRQEVAAPPPPPPAPFAPPAPTTSEVVVKPILPAYICPDGHRVELDHDASIGVLRVSRGGDSFVLQQQVSPAGHQRFVQDEDTLERFDGEIRLQRGSQTRQICAAVPAAPERGTIWGTVTKMDRMGIPAGTVARVLLVDAARADAPSIEIASTTISTTGNQVPLHFLIRYDADRVVPRGNSYRLQARLELPGGQLGWITDTAVFVLQTDAPQQPVELMVVRTGSAPQ